MKLFDFELVFSQIPTILSALPVTLELTLIATIIGYLLGLALALIKLKRVPLLRQLAAVYISVIRGTPILVQLYITYYGIPLVLKWYNMTYGTNYNINAIPAILFAVVALGLNQSAFDSEVIRAAIKSVDKGQVEAAKSMGMSSPQILRRVILPQAIPHIMPAYKGEVVGLIKATAVVGYISQCRI